MAKSITQLVYDELFEMLDDCLFDVIDKVVKREEFECSEEELEELYQDISSTLYGVRDFIED